MNSIFTSKKFFLSLLIVIIFGSASILTISYKVLQKLTASYKYDSLRQKRNSVAIAIRKKLVKNFGARVVTFTTSDNIKLSGLYIERDNAHGTIIACHGYRHNKEKMYDYIPLFFRYNFLLFDFRAHGQSQGDVTSIGTEEYKDVIAAAKFIQNLNENKKDHFISILGVSMGGAATLKAATIDPSICDALIIDSSYADLWELINIVYPKHTSLPVFPFLSIMQTMFIFSTGSDIFNMKPIEYVKNIKQPIFFIHAYDDRHTHSHDTLRLYGEANDSTQKKLWIGSHSDHARLHKDQPKIYKHKVTKFLSKVREKILQK